MGRKKILKFNAGHAISSVGGQRGDTRYGVWKQFGGVLALGVMLTAAVTGAKQASAASYSANWVGANLNEEWVTVRTDGNVSMELVPASTGAMGVGKNTVTVETNSATGYRLYVSGYNAEANGYTALYLNGDKNNSEKLLGTTNATPLPLTTANQWGYAVAGNGAEGNFSTSSTYEAVAGSGTILDSTTMNGLKWKGVKGDYQLLTSRNNGNAGSPDTIPVYYGAYVNNAVALGDYRNIIVYTAFVEGTETIAVSPAEIAYDSPIEITTQYMSTKDVPVTANMVRVSFYDNSDPSRNIASCSSITIDSVYNGTNNKPLKILCNVQLQENTDYGDYGLSVHINSLKNDIYVSYEKADGLKYVFKTLGDIHYLQDIRDNVCKNTQIWTSENSAEYVLYDKRDEKGYLVRRLADGNCWMVQNLALAGGKGLSSSDSDMTAGSYSLPNSLNPSTAGWQESSGTGYNSSWKYMYNGGTHIDGQKNNPVTAVGATPSNSGAYYSFQVAIAGSLSKSASSGAATQSICPKWWHLPTGGDIGREYNILASKYDKGDTGSNPFNVAFNVAFVGVCLSSACPSQHTDSPYTQYWASNVYNDTDGYYLSTSSSVTAPANHNLKYYGRSVRCMLTGGLD